MVTVFIGVFLKKEKLIKEILIKKLIKKLPNIKFDVYGMNSIEPIWSMNT